MDEEKSMIINELQTSSLIKILANTNSRRCAKSSVKSEEVRKKGNMLYVRNDHTAETHSEILELYSKSVALAPIQSEELALAYGNRSAFLLHIEKYEECIKDIDKALEITKSLSLKQKLLHRREDCLDFLKCLQETNHSSYRKMIGEISCEVNNNLSNVKSSSVAISTNCFKETKSHDNAVKSLKSTKTEEKGFTWKKILIKYNEKYGRHLVASQDIKPGEIILAAKPYVSSLIVKNPYLKCCHCLSMAWSGVPCDHCGWFLFCSNKCKTEAWEQYHEIECPCIPHLTYFLNHFETAHGCQVPFDGLSLRALIKGVTETGNLNILKKEMDIVDRCTDMRIRGFSKDGKFRGTEFRSLYSLSSHVPSQEVRGLIVFATAAVVCLAKYTSFFGKDFQFSKPEELINNVTNQCQYNRAEEECLKNLCCVQGLCIVPIGSLTNHSCNPNARRCFTQDFEYILYATHPIKKNAQIFDSYFCTFFESPNPDRQTNVQINFGFNCDCTACRDNWPHWPIVEMPFNILLASDTSLLNPQEKDFYEKNEKLVARVEEETCDYNLELLQEVSRVIEFSLKKLSQPSIITYKLTYMMMQVFERIHGFNPQNFDDCRL